MDQGLRKLNLTVGKNNHELELNRGLSKNNLFYQIKIKI